ncbi:MAG: nitroreductase family protein [Alteraurantiacibacter sp.]
MDGLTDQHHPYPHLPEYSDEQRIARAAQALERLRTRRSCRSFTDTPVPREIIEYAIRVAGTAPSGANHQPWHFTVVSSPKNKRAIREAAEAEEQRFYGSDGDAPKASEDWLGALAPIGTDARKPFLETAPFLIICFAQRTGGIEEDGETQNYYVNESVGIACGLLIATLHEAGLATLTHTPSPMGFLRDICGRPKNEKPLMIVVAGLPAEDASVPDHAVKKKPLEQISSWL